MLDDMRLLWQVGLMEAGRYLWDILQTFAYENERKSLRSKPGADLQGFKNFLIEYCVLRYSNQRHFAIYNTTSYLDSGFLQEYQRFCHGAA